jgi:hypothetical protein
MRADFEPIAARIAARCEIDLSAGTRSRPWKGPQGSNRMFMLALTPIDQ